MTTIIEETQKITNIKSLVGNSEDRTICNKRDTQFIPGGNKQMVYL